MCDQRHSTCLKKLQGTQEERVKLWVLYLSQIHHIRICWSDSENKIDFCQTVPHIGHLTQCNKVIQHNKLQTEVKETQYLKRGIFTWERIDWRGLALSYTAKSHWQDIKWKFLSREHYLMKATEITHLSLHLSLLYVSEYHLFISMNKY